MKNKNVFIIGKDPDPTFIANNERVYSISETADTEYVSRTHCRISIENGKMVIEDLNSTNGTYVDGQRISEPTSISLKNTITLGKAYVLNLENFKKHLVVQPIPEPAKQPQYADWWSRLGGYVLDSFFFGLLSLPLVLMFFLILSTSEGLRYADDAIFINIVGYILLIIGIIIITHFYYVIPISTRGSTYGRKIANVSYLDSTTLKYPSKLQVWFRLICYIFSSLIFMIGFFMPLWTEKKQALHDLIVNTIVIKTE